jgi:ribosomal-protein-alanine N-acetyltransferase
MVGHAVLMQVLDEAHLLNISLAEAQQGCGLGAAFLAYLSDVAKGQGATRMFLEVRVSNERARRFYERNGFAEIGRRRGYYPAAAGREDAIVMARDL